MSAKIFHDLPEEAGATLDTTGAGGLPALPCTFYGLCAVGSRDFLSPKHRGAAAISMPLGQGYRGCIRSSLLYGSDEAEIIGDRFLRDPNGAVAGRWRGSIPLTSGKTFFQERHEEPMHIQQAPNH